MAATRPRRVAPALVMAAWLVALAGRVDAFADATAPASRFQVPPGFLVEQVAGPPLVRYPLFAVFDDQGRLYVAEGTGTNLPGEELVKKKLGRIVVLEDGDGDGAFDASRVFVDELVFPQGVLWHDGALYAASHPCLWRIEDTDGDGRADRQDALVSRFNFNGNGCDIHGPFVGPDGRLYWTDGRHGYQVKTCEGPTLEGLASRIWRCRADGTEIERLCGGGFDNPVELAFTPEGELIGTMDQGPGDALLHYVEGGVYPMEHPCLHEFAMTGPLLGAVTQYTAALPVALCGLARYRSTQFGPDYQGSLFTAQFNVHRIEQHLLVRQGATFASVNRDFVTSLDYDVHPSDVLEDADGSLLFVDMGAWFNYGCPTSKIAKPEILGAIYRVRRSDAPSVADPWGKSLKMATRSPAELAALLDDPRPEVRDQAVSRLARLGSDAIPALGDVLRPAIGRSPGPRWVEARRNAVWALCRIASVEAQSAVRTALADADPSVRHAAVHAAGLARDQAAAPALMSIVVEDDPPLRLKAAESLGRIGRPDSVPALLESLRRGASDRHLEHALIYALIRIHDRAATLPALEDPHPRVRQAGLVALDQMPDGQLTREQAARLLDTDDADLQQAVLDCMSRRQGWSEDTVGLLSEWLTGAALSPGQEQSLTGALLAFSGDENIQKLVADKLAGQETTTTMRLLLLRVVARCRLDPLPERWLALVGQALEHEDLTVCREAIATLKARELRQFDAVLAQLSRRSSLPGPLRIAALDCIAGRLGQLDSDLFALLTGQLSETSEPLLRITAARTLSASSLDSHQLAELARYIADAGPIEVPHLATAFSRADHPESGEALVKALEQSPGADALSADDLDRLLKGYPARVQDLARTLRDRLAARQNQQAAYLTQLMLDLLQKPGSPEGGREAFFSKKVGCYACHRAGGKGGNLGPDLSQVGRFRTARDLLEAIVFPSSSIVPHYRSWVVNTKDGRVVTGMIVRESSEGVDLRTPQLAEIRVAASDVDELMPSQVSLMPEGLERTMTRQELSDLVEFLYQQR